MIPPDQTANFNDAGPRISVPVLLLQQQAVMLNFKEPFTWASGIRSPIYCDNRVLLSGTAARGAVVEAFLAALRAGPDFDVVAGVSTSGIPWATLIADRLDKPMVYVRPEPKGHGKHNAIEGRLASGAKVIVIEDLISTAGSMLKCVGHLREADADVVQCYAIFTYELTKAADALAEAAVGLTVLGTFTELVEAARSMGVLSTDEIAKVLLFKEDP
ncbi:orotate phosphoribosyltransferase, partial [Candidatus Woesearchaeota archaeon CG11_big_fil_rev_8_21_14_0_20_57_5]